MSILDRREITTAEVRRFLEARGEDLDPLQRRVLDYTVKFSKLSADEASALVEELARDGLVDRGLAVQMVNCLPASVEEVRAFIGRQRIVSEEVVNTLLRIIEKYRSAE